MISRKAQNLFIRLSKRHISRRSVFHSRKGYKIWWKNVFPSITTPVTIINAVTGEKTTARAYERSALGLKKWLKLRNVRAQFSDMFIPKNSTWYKLSDEEFKDYPVIVKVGTYQVPYLIDHVENRAPKGNKIFCSVCLKTVDNVDYLTVILEKKKLIGTVSKSAKKPKKKKIIPRKLRKIEDWG